MKFLRFFLAVLAASALAACAGGTSDRLAPMPPRFLGYWNPIFDSCYQAHIYADGRIVETCKTDTKLSQTSHYKIIHIATPDDIYLAVYSPAAENRSWPGPSDYYEFVRLKVGKGEISGKDEVRWTQLSNFNAAEWGTFSPARLWKKFQDDLRNGAEGSGEGYYIRP